MEIIKTNDSKRVRTLKQLFANDPNDKRWVVEKRIGVGYTFNFGTKGGRAFFFIIVGLPVIFIIFLLIMNYLGKI